MRRLHGGFGGIFINHYKCALYAGAVVPYPVGCVKVAQSSAIFAVWRAVFAGGMAIFSHPRAKIAVRRAIFADGWAKIADRRATFADQCAVFALGWANGVEAFRELV